MVFSSLAITAATCISGCSGIGTGLTISELEEKSTAVLTEAASIYDYSDFDLTYGQGESVMKQAILSYGEKNGFFSNVEASYVRGKIKSENEYVYCPDIDSMFMKEGLLEEKAQYAADLAVFKSVQKSADPNKVFFSGSSTDAPAASSVNAVSMGGSGMSFGKDDSGVGGGKEKINFPKKECKADSVAFYGSGVVNGHPFFGILLTPDFCIDVYNNISSWFNKQEMYKASGIKGPAGMVYEIWKALDTYGPAVGFTAVSAFTTQVVSYMGELISPLLVLLQNTNPVGIAIAAILAIISAAVVIFFSIVFWLGYEGRGYALGWEVCGLFSWNWINEGL